MPACSMAWLMTLASGPVHDGGRASAAGRGSSAPARPPGCRAARAAGGGLQVPQADAVGGGVPQFARTSSGAERKTSGSMNGKSFLDLDGLLRHQRRLQVIGTHDQLITEGPQLLRHRIEPVRDRPELLRQRVAVARDEALDPLDHIGDPIGDLRCPFDRIGQVRRAPPRRAARSKSPRSPPAIGQLRACRRRCG